METPMDAIALLKGQHRTVEELFSNVAASSGAEQQRLFRELFDTLVAHDAIERELFYPACERLGDATITEFVAEHGVIEFSLYRSDLERGDTSFDGHLRVLEEAIERHVLSEETELFPRVEQALDAAARAALGERMERRFEAVLAGDCHAVLRDRLKEVLGESFSARTKRSGDRKGVRPRPGARFAR
jgi:hemerythrin superfamily protein